MSAPAGRVLPRRGDVALRFRGIHNLLDPTTQARCGFGLLRPERPENDEHILGRDGVDGLWAERRGVFFERHPPLGAVLRVAPARLQRRDQFIGEGAETWRSLRLGATRINRVLARRLPLA